MSLLKFFHKEISKKKTFAILLVSISIYLLLSILLRMLSNQNIAAEMPFLPDLFFLRGIITQLQMMISVFLVLILNRGGFTTAITLNALSLVSATLFVLISKSTTSVPGIISYTAVIIIVILIRMYKTQAEDYSNQIDLQNKQLDRSDKKLYELAYYDSLTKLPNKEMYLEQLAMEVQKAGGENRHLGVIFIDLDSFKTVNDILGYSAGNAVLVETAKRFSDVVDENVLVSRVGGDEFFLLIRNVTHVEDIEKAVIKIMGAFHKPVIIKEIEFFISGSTGVAVYPDDGQDATELIINAEISMYEAKKRGKNQYLFCNEDLKQAVRKEMSMTNSLYKALENDEFILHYQPQINIETGSIIGLEALLRWKHPEYGLIFPGEFISLAEETGLIKPIGLWVFKTVCEECQKCNSEYKDQIRILINFSVEQLKDINIVRQLIEIVEEKNIDPHKIEIEITESVVNNPDTSILEKLIELKKMGFLIAVDDFGKEYSSLNRIRSFPIDHIKIDMDFIHSISSGNEKDRAIVKTIIQLAKNLGVKVLAEGVETKEQYEFLKSEHCDEIQGFYFYKGMPASETEMLLENQK